MAIGLFGKLPSQGDFVSRRLPWEFTSAWDDWLQAGLSRAKSTIGSAWNDAYLTAPLWRFQLSPGVLGANGWIGLWFASVDRVGRQFPLALVEALPADRCDRYVLLEQDEAYFATEDVALRGLDPRLGFDAFDRGLDGLSLLTQSASVAPAVAQVVELLPATREPPSGPVQRFPADADARTVLVAAEAEGPAKCCFFTWGNEHHPPQLYRRSGLPADHEFHGFIDGRWS